MKAQGPRARRAGLAGLGVALLCAAQPAFAAPAYGLAAAVPLGAPDRWDYVVFDQATRRAYVAHSDHLDVFDPAAGRLVGKVEGLSGSAHGSAISADAGQGFVADGKTGEAVVFDLSSFSVLKRVSVGPDADAVALDPATGRVFVVEGDPGEVSVIDPKTDASAASVKTGERLEYAAADDRGAVFVAGVEKRDLLRIDARAGAVTARWRVPDCAAPHGLALDRERRRLFMGCMNQKMMVVDADSGRVVAELPIGRGSDAVAYDSKRRRVFSSNGEDGTVSIFLQTGPDAYTALPTLQTRVSGRTMAVDPESGALFVAAAEVDASPERGGRPRPRAGSLALLVFLPTD